MDFHSKCTLGAFSVIILVVFSTSLAYGENSIKKNTDFENIKILHYAEPLSLQCNLTNPSPDIVVKWTKNGKPIQSDTGDRPNIVITQKGPASSLNIKAAMQDDVANYTCLVINSKNNNTESVPFEVVGKPYVKLPDFATVIEGEKLKLECTVVASHNPTVEWKVGNISYEESDGKRVKLSSDPTKDVKNSILELEPAEMNDRGHIYCIGHNVATTIESPNNSSTYVRVKDKYAALWPFLGICAEVIVLCTVIFIYEKKRNKTELEESDTDQSPEQKNTPDHGKDSVRQRK